MLTPCYWQKLLKIVLSLIYRESLTTLLYWFGYSYHLHQVSAREFQRLPSPDLLSGEHNLMCLTFCDKPTFPMAHV